MKSAMDAVMALLVAQSDPKLVSLPLFGDALPEPELTPAPPAAIVTDTVEVMSAGSIRFASHLPPIPPIPPAAPPRPDLPLPPPEPDPTAIAQNSVGSSTLPGVHGRVHVEVVVMDCTVQPPTSFSLMAVIAVLTFAAVPVPPEPKNAL